MKDPSGMALFEIEPRPLPIAMDEAVGRPPWRSDSDPTSSTYSDHDSTNGESAR